MLAANIAQGGAPYSQQRRVPGKEGAARRTALQAPGSAGGRKGYADDSTWAACAPGYPPCHPRAV
jgi:hypothetical protein